MRVSVENRTKGPKHGPYHSPAYLLRAIDKSVSGFRGSIFVIHQRIPALLLQAIAASNHAKIETAKEFDGGIYRAQNGTVFDRSSTVIVYQPMPLEQEINLAKRFFFLYGTNAVLLRSSASGDLYEVCPNDEYMEQWQREAEYVMSVKQEDEAYMLSRDDRNQTKRKAHDAFQMEWGFSDFDIPDLDRAIAMLILPRLAYFRDKTVSIPNKMLESGGEADEAAAFQEWQRILDTICAGLHLYIEKYPNQFSKEEQALWNQAKQYLFDYFEHLWI